jgi:hypothetical protein
LSAYVSSRVDWNGWKPTESGFVETQDRVSRLEEELQSLREQRDVHIAAIANVRGKLRSEVIRIRDTLDKVLNIDRTFGEKLRTIFTEQGITLVSIMTAISAILAAIITALIGGGGAPAASGGDGPPEPGAPASAKEYVSSVLDKFSKLTKTLATTALAALPGISGAVVSCLLRLVGGAAS